MPNRIRTLLPKQFGLLELFMLTTVAAIAFAIFRLPYSLSIKVLLLFILWTGFQVWVAKTSGRGPTRQVRMAVMSGVGMAIQLTPLCADLILNRGKFPLWFELPFGLSVVGLVLFQVALTSWQVRSALQSVPEQA